MSLLSFDRAQMTRRSRATLREGWPYILGLALLGCVLWRWRPLAGLAGLATAGAIASFFRDPAARWSRLRTRSTRPLMAPSSAWTWSTIPGSSGDRATASASSSRC